MKRTEREGLDAYYREADSWATDRREALLSSRRRAWIVAAVATGVALFEACALVMLAPLKTVVPYTLMVDRTTGYVQELKPVGASTIAPDAALTQSFLVQYVIARESFDADTLQANYHKTTLWSAEAAQGDYVAAMQASNPLSALARLPRSTVIDTEVKSVSPLGDHAALVRFDTRRRDAGGQFQSPHAWIAVIRYRFSGAPLRLEDRFLNPLGFQVLRYRRDEETLPVVPVVQPAPIPKAVPAAAPVTRPSQDTLSGVIVPASPARFVGNGG